MNVIEHHRKDFLISTDKSKLDLEVIHEFLSQHSYWAQGRSRASVEKSIRHSLCFGVFGGGQQVGFARVVTDRVTFAWLCDVFILESHRGRGLGTWLIESVVEHPELKNVRRILLGTRDAHELYRRHGGFNELTNPERWMERLNSI